MYAKIGYLILALVCVSDSLTTVYKYNNNKALELESESYSPVKCVNLYPNLDLCVVDLVPVSSTVIPLPIYQVGYGLSARSPFKDEKIKKPEGPIALVTVNDKKRAIPQQKLKPKLREISSLKEIRKTEFPNRRLHMK